MKQKNTAAHTTFKSFDGMLLHYRVFEPPTDAKAVLIFVHGMNEHLGRYQNPIQYFSPNYKMYFFDLRGHGLSPGRRSYVNSFQDFVRDLQAFVDFVFAKEPNKKIFLVAHSMGGQIALNYLALPFEKPLAGFIASSPNVRIAFKLTPIEIFFARFLNFIFPTFSLPNHVKASDLSHDPAVIYAYETDPLVTKKPTARLGYEVVSNQREVLMDLAQKITLPTFMMHSGDDNVCAKEGTVDFFHKLGAKDKTLKIYPHAFHELFNEAEKDEVFADMQRWIEARL